jgi:hypothetical protein
LRWLGHICVGRGLRGHVHSSNSLLHYTPSLFREHALSPVLMGQPVAFAKRYERRIAERFTNGQNREHGTHLQPQHGQRPCTPAPTVCTGWNSDCLIRLEGVVWEHGISTGEVGMGDANTSTLCVLTVLVCGKMLAVVPTEDYDWTASKESMVCACMHAHTSECHQHTHVYIYAQTYTNRLHERECMHALT